MTQPNFKFTYRTDPDGTVWLKRDQVALLCEMNANLFDGNFGYRRCVQHLRILASRLRAMG